MNTITYLKNQLGYWFLFAMMFAVVACADDKDEETLNAPGKTTFHVEDVNVHQFFSFMLHLL